MRRMLSINIINSAKFLKMPQESQNLYFHLCVRGDDDGIVEAYPIMRMIGANEDNLKVLLAKAFVTLLNDDDVVYINDWREHNNIRADRKVNSQYLPLLLKIMPDLAIIEPKQRSDLARPENKMTVHGLSTDSPYVKNGRHRIGKDRLGEDRKDIDRESGFEKLYTPVQEFDPTNHEESLAKDIATELGEEYINFTLSVVKKHGIDIAQRAFTEVQESKAVQDKRKLFNHLIKKLADQNI